MDSNQKPNVITSLEALSFVWDILLGIAIPILFFALAGRWIDTRFNVSPYGSFIGLLLALAVVTVIVTKQAKTIAARMKTPPKT